MRVISPQTAAANENFNTIPAPQDEDVKIKTFYYIK